MYTGKLEHLRPFEKLVFFIVFCILSGALFSFVSVGVASKMFSVSINEFSDLTQEDSIHAMKFTNLFFHLGAFIFPSLVFSKLFTNSHDEFLLFRNIPRIKTVGLILLMFPGLIIASDLLFYVNKMIDFGVLSEDLYNRIVYEQAIRDKAVYAYIGGTYKSLFSSLILLALIPAVGEELVFRGVLQNLLVKITRKLHVSILFTAFVFAFIHFQFLDFLPRFMLGIIFGYVVFLTGSLWSSILLHFLNNALFVFIEFLIKNEVLDYSIKTQFTVNFFYFILSFALIFIPLILLIRNNKINNIQNVYLD